MGEVWLATEIRLCRKVALKLLRPELTRDPSRVARFDEAIASSRRGRELDPLSAVPGVSLGVTLFNARRYVEAIRELRSALALHPENAPAFGFLALALTEAGHHDQAVRMAERAVALSDRRPVAPRHARSVLRSSRPPRGCASGRRRAGTTSKDGVCDARRVRVRVYGPWRPRWGAGRARAGLRRARQHGEVPEGQPYSRHPARRSTIRGPRSTRRPRLSTRRLTSAVARPLRLPPGGLVAAAATGKSASANRQSSIVNRQYTYL